MNIFCCGRLLVVGVGHWLSWWAMGGCGGLVGL